MHNNDIFRRIRYIFNYSDNQMIDIFAQGDLVATRAEISDWLKREDNADFKEITGPEFAAFLNGLINLKRGKREGAQPVVEKRLNNNIILNKLKIAFNLKAEDVLAILDLANFKLGKSELSAFFRKKESRQYRVCQDQVLRNFLMGLQKKYRVEPAKEEPVKTEK